MTDEIEKNLGGGATPMTNEMAPLQRGLPVGPVLVITGGYTAEDVLAQRKKNEEELATRKVKP